MPQKDRDALNGLAKAYGASPGGFLAEMVGAMCSEHPDRIKAFMGKLMLTTNQEMTRKANELLDEMMQPHKPPQEPLKQPKGKKGAKRYVRPT